MKTYKIHPVARLFPTLEAKEMGELRDDIKARGIVTPILVNKARDTIIDGRNRWMIATELKMDGKVPMEVFEGDDADIPNEIISRNILRRHLTDDQRAAIIAKIRGPQLEKEAAERKGARTDLALKSASGSAGGKFGSTADAVAKEAKVGRDKARAALDVSKHAKEIVDDVIGGKVPLKAAAKVARTRKPSKPRAKKEKTLQQIVEAKFSRFMEGFPHHQRREVRSILRKML